MNRAAAPDDPPPGRLVPAMASMRLQVLDFVRGYIVRWGGSPSYGEIAAAMGTNRPRVHHAVRSLVTDGLLHQRRGPRGLSMPSDERAAIRALRAQGWTVDEARRRVTNRSLSPVPFLDYRPGSAERDRSGHGSE